jgi:hypothetical protein
MINMDPVEAAVSVDSFIDGRCFTPDRGVLLVIKCA